MVRCLVACVVSWKIIFAFQKNLSVQKYARLCNAIINVKDCCKRNSGLLFPSSGGFSCDVPDKEYIYEVSISFAVRGRSKDDEGDVRDHCRP